MPHRHPESSSSPIIPPPPFGPSYNVNNSKQNGVHNPNHHDLPKNQGFKSSSRSNGPIMAVPYSSHTHLAVIKPMTRTDILALIFVFLILPQGISMLLLLAYILSGSFKSIASKLIARYLTQWDCLSSAKAHTSSFLRMRHHRSELLGQFVQLFSINSAILLACYYILPQSWFYYLAVLAKSIIASKLVGSYISGSTTFVSVVNPPSSSSSSHQQYPLHHPNHPSNSNQQSSPLATAHTTISNTGSPSSNFPAWNPSSSFSTTKNDPKNSFTSVINSVMGCSLVIIIDNVMNNFVLDLNVPRLVADVARFYKGLCHVQSLSSVGSDIHSYLHYDTFIRAFFTKSPFLASLSYLAPRKDTFSIGHRRFHDKSSVLTKSLFHAVVRCFGFTDPVATFLDAVLHELSTVMNYAYLVLCIHVISLTVSPFLHRFFILKDYLKNLDNLSSLTPELSFSNYRPANSALTVSSAKDASALDSVVVVNVDHHASSSQSGAFLSNGREPLEVNVKTSIAPSPHRHPEPHYNRKGFATPASNFEVFCLSSPFNKPTTTASPASSSSSSLSAPPVPAATATNTSNRANLPNAVSYNSNGGGSNGIAIGKTNGDRRNRSNSSIPHHQPASTTIYDKNFAKSVQPLWSWIAAIKILALRPLFFAGKATTRKDNGVPYHFSPVSDESPVAVFGIEESRVLIAVLNRERVPLATRSFSIVVNGVSWRSAFWYTDNTMGVDVVSVEGLMAGQLYEIAIVAEKEVVSHTVVTTVDGGKGAAADSIDVDMVEKSTQHLQTKIDELRAHFRKVKRDENKKSGELKKQIESIKSKMDRFWAKLDDGKSTGKFKGLQNSVAQLEQEIKTLKAQIDEFWAEEEHSESVYKKEELALNEQICQLEQFIQEHEQSTHMLKGDIKAVEVDKNNFAVKQKRLAGKIDAHKEEIAKANGELKQLRKAMLMRFQRRQKKIQERFDSILPKVNDAIDDLLVE